VRNFNRGPVSDLGDVAAGARETFLATPRATLLCAREFDSLSDHIAARMAAGTSAGELPQADVRRAPGRCIVQLGPVGLTVSWVRARNDTVPDGRLLVIQWLGVVARGISQRPERPIPADPSRTARVLAELQFTADASSEREWFWRDDAPPQVRYRSPDLAERCVTDLLGSMYRTEGR
jgi:hypothetical protein